MTHRRSPRRSLGVTSVSMIMSAACVLFQACMNSLAWLPLKHRLHVGVLEDNMMEPHAECCSVIAFASKSRPVIQPHVCVCVLACRYIHIRCHLAKKWEALCMHASRQRHALESFLQIKHHDAARNAHLPTPCVELCKSQLQTPLYGWSRPNMQPQGQKYLEQNLAWMEQIKQATQ